MGRGSSGRGGNVERSLTLRDGTVIDLSGSPLQYGGNSSTPANVRSVVEGFEVKRRDNSIEYGYAVDANGNVLEEKRGSKGSVRTSYYALNNADTYTHVHPREKGSASLSGTFSVADLRNWSMFNVREYRATGREGTYSIAKQSNFDAKGALRYFNDTERTLRSAYTKAAKDIQSDYNKKAKAIFDGPGDRTQKLAAHETILKEAQGRLDRATNKMLVDLHNGYMKGQKQFGYTYTLERRK